MFQPKFEFSFRSHQKKLLREMRVRYRTSLIRIGAYTKKVAERSIRNRKNISKPGQFPTNQTGAIKNFIRWGLEKGDTGVVIGPTLLPRPKNRYVPSSVDKMSRKATRLAILMFGGTQKRRAGSGGRVRFESRPFMQKSLQKAIEAKNLQSAFKEIGF